MAGKLFYTLGDPDYLKVVLLREVFGTTATCFEVVEGEVYELCEVSHGLGYTVPTFFFSFFLFYFFIFYEKPPCRVANDVTGIA